MAEEADTLRSKGINPSAQRVAVARFVLHTKAHPSADEVWSHVRRDFPMVSRATIYNTLNLFVEKGLLRQFSLREGHVVFDPNISAHHHFIDEESGAIIDIPWDALRVKGIAELTDLDAKDYQVVVRGTRRRSPSA